MTKFCGKFFLINFAVGVVTGIVQEFQFGMNWSAYSRFVGDIFGAPLAMEGLLAFFLESTFLGLWIFGWDKLPPRLHLATIWLAAIGTSLISAYFILAANSWMQHPVGYRINPVDPPGAAHQHLALLTNSTALAAFPHVIFGRFMHRRRRVVVGVSAWHLARSTRHRAVSGKSMRLGLSSRCSSRRSAPRCTGDIQGQADDRQQPMKMAAAEALYTHRDAGVVLAVHDRQR